MPFPVDFAYLDTAIVLAAGGLFFHWFRRMNSIFTKFEEMRFHNEKRLLMLEAALHEHVEVSDQVWEDVGRRLNRLEANGRVH